METTFRKERSLASELSISSIQLDRAKVQQRRRHSLQFTPVHIMHKHNDLELYIKENVENCTESLISDRKSRMLVVSSEKSQSHSIPQVSKVTYIVLLFILKISLMLIHIKRNWTVL